MILNIWDVLLLTHCCSTTVLHPFRPAEDEGGGGSFCLSFRLHRCWTHSSSVVFLFLLSLFELRDGALSLRSSATPLPLPSHPPSRVLNFCSLSVTLHTPPPAPTPTPPSPEVWPFPAATHTCVSFTPQTCKQTEPLSSSSKPPEKQFQVCLHLSDQSAGMDGC